MVRVHRMAARAPPNRFWLTVFPQFVAAFFLVVVSLAGVSTSVRTTRTILNRIIISLDLLNVVRRPFVGDRGHCKQIGYAYECLVSPTEYVIEMVELWTHRNETKRSVVVAPRISNSFYRYLGTVGQVQRLHQIYEFSVRAFFFSAQLAAVRTAEGQHQCSFREWDELIIIFIDVAKT